MVQWVHGTSGFVCHRSPSRHNGWIFAKLGSHQRWLSHYHARLLRHCCRGSLSHLDCCFRRHHFSNCDHQSDCRSCGASVSVGGDTHKRSHGWLCGAAHEWHLHAQHCGKCSWRNDGFISVSHSGGGGGRHPDDSRQPSRECSVERESRFDVSGHHWSSFACGVLWLQWIWIADSTVSIYK